jgi:hypothetical protein
MEVWFEGLAMHLSVGMPLPKDLEFDIYNFSGEFDFITYKCHYSMIKKSYSLFLHDNLLIKGEVTVLQNLLLLRY